jgi:maltose-binding protein MalE
MTSTRVQLELARTLSVQPSDLEARKDPYIMQDPTLRASRDQIDKGKLMPIVPEMRAIWDAMRPNYQSVLNGELSPDEGARRMQQRAETMIKRMRE